MYETNGFTNIVVNCNGIAMDDRYNRYQAEKLKDGKIDEELQFYKLCASGDKLESIKIRKVEEQVDELVQYYKKSWVS